MKVFIFKKNFCDNMRKYFKSIFQSLRNLFNNLVNEELLTFLYDTVS